MFLKVSVMASFTFWIELPDWRNFFDDVIVCTALSKSLGSPLPLPFEWLDKLVGQIFLRISRDRLKQYDLRFISHRQADSCDDTRGSLNSCCFKKKKNGGERARVVVLRFSFESHRVHPLLAWLFPGYSACLPHSWNITCQWVRGPCSIYGGRKWSNKWCPNTFAPCIYHYTVCERNRPYLVRPCRMCRRHREWGLFTSWFSYCYLHPKIPPPPVTSLELACWSARVPTCAPRHS